MVPTQFQKFQKCCRSIPHISCKSLPQKQFYCVQSSFVGRRRVRNVRLRNVVCGEKLNLANLDSNGNQLSYLWALGGNLQRFIFEIVFQFLRLLTTPVWDPDVVSNIKSDRFRVAYSTGFCILFFSLFMLILMHYNDLIIAIEHVGVQKPYSHRFRQRACVHQLRLSLADLMNPSLMTLMGFMLWDSGSECSAGKKLSVTSQRAKYYNIFSRYICVLSLKILA